MIIILYISNDLCFKKCASLSLLQFVTFLNRSLKIFVKISHYLIRISLILIYAISFILCTHDYFIDKT